MADWRGQSVLMWWVKSPTFMVLSISLARNCFMAHFFTNCWRWAGMGGPNVLVFVVVTMVVGLPSSSFTVFVSTIVVTVSTLPLALVLVASASTAYFFLFSGDTWTAAGFLSMSSLHFSNSARWVLMALWLYGLICGGWWEFSRP